MALLITESLDATRREHAHQHIEGCEVCGNEWGAWRETWSLMGELPEVEVPARVIQRRAVHAPSRDEVACAGGGGCRSRRWRVRRR
jgi:hypothetical protein